MSDVKRYVPILNGTAFMGMVEVGGHEFAPHGQFVCASDFDELKTLYEDAVRRFCDLRQQTKFATQETDDVRNRTTG